MSDRVTDFLIELAESESTRAAYKAAPDAVIAARGFTAEEAAALRSGDDARIFALYTERRPTPVIAKIIWTSDDDLPAETPPVAKIIWTSDDEPAETPAVAKIIWTSDDDEAGETKRFAKCA